MSKNDELDPKGLARRNALKAGVAAGVGAALPGLAAQAKAGEGSGATDELTFVNGRIHTMDDDNRVVSSVAIRDGRFVAVGNAANPGPGASSPISWCSTATTSASATPTCAGRVRF